MSTANPSTSNTDGVKQQDRQATGPQPDQTPVGPGGTPSGGGATPTGPAGGDLAGAYPNPSLATIGGGAIGPLGSSTRSAVVTRDAKGRVTALTDVAITYPATTPTGPAGGDLAGTYPNPTLAVIGAAAGPTGDATHVSVVTIDAKGRVTGLTPVAISFPASASDYPYNVKNFGAVGDGVTDDTAAIQGAANALTGAGRGCLFFPDGRYIISSTIIVGSGIAYTGTPPAPYNANFTICGSGRLSAVLIQTGAGQGGIYVNLTGGSNFAWNRAECFNLGFRVGNGVTAGTALEFDYGVVPATSSEQPSGSVIHSVDIGRDSPTFSGGWTDGILIENPWKFVAYDINIFGCDAGNVVPTAGAGSGCALQLIGGFNIFIDKIYTSFFQTNIQLDGAGGFASQGVMLSNIIAVAVIFGFRVLADAGISNIQLSNWLVDQGNSPNNGFNNFAFYIDGDPGGGRGNVSMVNCSWVQVAGVGSSCGLYINNVSNSCFTALNAFNNGVGGSVVVDGNSQNNNFTNGVYAGGQITCTAATDGNEFNCIRTSTFSNSGGGGNVALATLF